MYKVVKGPNYKANPEAHTYHIDTAIFQARKQSARENHIFYCFDMDLLHGDPKIRGWAINGVWFWAVDCPKCQGNDRDCTTCMGWGVVEGTKSGRP